ncbi:MAG: TIR domain-containing protein [Anaerolineales bacterium]|nr:TIR domain-containing protein [Anaerolineales bacterium]
MPQTTTPKQPLKVFLCHSSEDKVAVRALYKRLTQDGIDAWLDKEKLLPGQDWESEIREAVREADIVVVCLSKQFNQEGFQQQEVKWALDAAMKQPEDNIFIIPARLEECNTLQSLRKWHWVNLFEENGYQSLMKAFRTRADKINATLQMNQEQISKTTIERETVLEDAGENLSEDDQKKPLYRLHPSIIVALITVFGTIVAAIIGARGLGIGVTPSPTSIPATAVVYTETTTPTSVPTETATPNEPTAIPSTDTPVPTFTPLPVTLGQDWLAGCISTLWEIYPSTVSATDRGDGCWQEPLHTFSAENGDLDFLAERGKGPSEIYGLFVLLPESGTVTFTARLRELNNADLWMGVFTEPDINSPGLLMAILNGSVNSRAVVQKDPSTYETLQGSQGINQGNGFSISFRFNALSATSIVNPHVFVINSVSMPSTQKWLFLGYKGLNNRYRIDGTFLNFELK